MLTTRERSQKNQGSLKLCGENWTASKVESPQSILCQSFPPLCVLLLDHKKQGANNLFVGSEQARNPLRIPLDQIRFIN